MALAPEHVLMGAPVQVGGARAPGSDGVHTFLAAFSFSRRFENQPCSCVASSPMIALICRRVRGSSLGHHGAGAGWCKRWRTSASASPAGVTPFSSPKAASSSATVSRENRAFFSPLLAKDGDGVTRELPDGEGSPPAEGLVDVAPLDTLVADRVLFNKVLVWHAVGVQDDGCEVTYGALPHRRRPPADLSFFVHLHLHQRADSWRNPTPRLALVLLRVVASRAVLHTHTHRALPPARHNMHDLALRPAPVDLDHDVPAHCGGEPLDGRLANRAAGRALSIGSRCGSCVSHRSRLCAALLALAPSVATATRLVVNPPARLPRLPASVHPLVLVAGRHALLARYLAASPVRPLLLPAEPVLPLVRAVGQHDARLELAVHEHLQHLGGDPRGRRIVAHLHLDLDALAFGRPRPSGGRRRHAGLRTRRKHDKHRLRSFDTAWRWLTRESLDAPFSAKLPFGQASRTATPVDAGHVAETLVPAGLYAGRIHAAHLAGFAICMIRVHTFHALLRSKGAAGGDAVRWHHMWGRRRGRRRRRRGRRVDTREHGRCLVARPERSAAPGDLLQDVPNPTKLR
eukprot:scaffold28255_cov63-Phaeocystis_antarctica.AAC.2